MPTPRLADLTTLRVGGPIADFADAGSDEELIALVTGADRAGEPVLVLGGGSNLLASDDPFDGLVVRHAAPEVTLIESPDGPIVRASAGMIWDDFVAFALSEGLSGLEALSGIPGSVGAAPVQNVGAYGAEVGDTLVKVRAWDRATGRIVDLTRDDLALGYRTSVIKRSIADGGPDGRAWGPTGRWIVLEADFLLARSDQSSPVRYGELARRLGVEGGQCAPATLVRDTILALRRSKGMVLDAADHDTWSAGSFFTNPILPADRAAALPDKAPRFLAGDGLVKSSAAWLIDHAGFPKGWAVPGAAPDGASLSTKHVLALTNRGAATASDIVELALAVRAGVEERFGVRLVPEPVAVGVTW